MADARDTHDWNLFSYLAAFIVNPWSKKKFEPSDLNPKLQANRNSPERAKVTAAQIAATFGTRKRARPK